MTCRGSTTTTSNQHASVHITVAPAYMPAVRDNGKNWFSYHITIHNNGTAPLRLLTRYWRITDGENEVREVEGEGVVGRQPLISPGEEFDYTSYVDFSTPVGYMEGNYTMETMNGTLFSADIDLFTLSLPSALN